MNPRISRLVDITAIVLIIFGAVRLFGPFPLRVNQVTTQKQTTFDVSATDSIAAIPDTAEVNLGVQINKATVGEAQKEANKKINTITDAVKKLGIDEKDIKTTDYSVYPNYDYQAGQRITGYNVNINLRIKVRDFDKINQVIESGAALGANQIGQLYFSVDDDRLEKLKMQARKEAIEKAKTKAKEIASMGDFQLGRVVNIAESENGYTPTPLRLQMEKALDSSGTGAPDIQAGESEIKVTVTLSYETL